MSMFGKLKALIKYIDLKWGSGRQKPLQYEGMSFLYIDNKQENFFYQISNFFDTGVLDAEKTVVVLKFYFSNYLNVVKFFKTKNIKFSFFLFYRQIPSIENRIIFYPYNSQSNCRLILNRSALHVFLTHGESNKKASVNRMIRLYDYVLAAGEFSSERYISNKVFSEYDLSEGRVIKLGAALVSPCFVDLSADATEDCIVYMPTWEGGLDAENFSSLAEKNTEKILIAVCNNLKTQKIIFKPHPNTGSRIKKYLNKLFELIDSLRAKDYKIFIDPEYLKTIPKNFISKKFLFPYHENLKIIYGVVDISAAEFMLAAKKVPTIVLLKKHTPMIAPKIYNDLRYPFLIDVQDSKGVAYIKDNLNLIFQADLQNIFFDMAISCEKEFEGKNAKQLHSCLIAYLSNRNNVGN